MGVFVAGCGDPMKSTNVDLGDDFVLLRTSTRDVSVVDWRQQSGAKIEHVVQLGYDSNSIVAVTISAGSTNYWVVDKHERTATGPLGLDQYEGRRAESPSLRELDMKKVWAVR
jgi:hypothetical protein